MSSLTELAAKYAHAVAHIDAINIRIDTLRAQESAAQKELHDANRIAYIARNDLLQAAAPLRKGEEEVQMVNMLNR